MTMDDPVCRTSPSPTLLEDDPPSIENVPPDPPYGLISAGPVLRTTPSTPHQDQYEYQDGGKVGDEHGYADEGEDEYEYEDQGQDEDQDKVSC